MIRLLSVSLLILITGFFPLRAQVSIDTLKGMLRAVYLPGKDSVIRTYEDGYGLSAPDDPINEKRYRVINWSEVNAFSDFFVNEKNELVMIDRVDASVARVTADRIDSSERAGFPKMFIERTTFQHPSGIYMYGGYGFWSARNRLVRVSDDYKWEPVMFNSTASSAKMHPPGLFESQAVVIKNEAWFFNGRTVNPADPLEKPYYNEVWVYDIEEKYWKKKGTIKPDFFDGTPHSRILISRDDRAYILRDEKGVLELFPDKNYAVVYSHSLISIEILNSDMWRYAPFFRDGKVYFFRNLDPDRKMPYEEMSYELKAVSLEEFLGDKIGEEEFYQEDLRFLKDLRFWFVLLLIVGYLTYRLAGGIRAKPRAALTETGIRYRSEHYDLPAVDLAVLRKLYEAGSAVPSNEILRLVENPNLQYSHNNRVKNEVIGRLNIQLQSILNTKEELITMRTSDTDKRYKWYELKRGWF